MGRYIAKNLVAADLCRKCLVQVAYAIGVAEPVGLYVNTYGTSKHSSQYLVSLIKDNFKLKPKDITSELDLLKPWYKSSASYGHFGRSEFPWEKTIKNLK